MIESRSVVAQEWREQRAEGRGHKETEEHLGGDGYAHYLGCGDGFTSVYTCQNLPNYTTRSLFNVSYTSTKQFKNKRNPTRKCKNKPRQKNQTHHFMAPQMAHKALQHLAPPGMVISSSPSSIPSTLSPKHRHFPTASQSRRGSPPLSCPSSLRPADPKSSE